MRQPHQIDDLFESQNAKATFMQHPLVAAAFAEADLAYKQTEKMLANPPGGQMIVGASPTTAAVSAFLEELGLELSWPNQ